MKVITAPQRYSLQEKECSVFLAGGITGCPNWQQTVIKSLEKSLRGSPYEQNIVVFNPRRKNFPINKPSASYEQIKWEYDQLSKMDIFSIYFCNSDSDQPICMYELGRYICQMQTRFPKDWENRIIISIESGYKRTQDVLIQTYLACGDKVRVEEAAQPDNNSLIFNHVQRIVTACRYLQYGRNM